jgi:hypothetical protein
MQSVLLFIDPELMSRILFVGHCLPIRSERL